MPPFPVTIVISDTNIDWKHTRWPIVEELDRDNWALKGRIRKQCNLTNTQLGQYHAHVQIWKHAQWTQQNLCVVDHPISVPLTSLSLFWNRVQKMTFDLLYLVHDNSTPTSYQTQFMDDPNVVQLQKNPSELGMYIVSPRGAQKLLNHAIPYDFPVGAFVAKQSLDVFAMYPSPITLTKQTPLIRIPGVRYKRHKAYPSATQVKSGRGSLGRTAHTPTNKPREVTTRIKPLGNSKSASSTNKSSSK